MKILDLPEGTNELLKVAKKNDRQNAMANNYALLACYTFSERILEISNIEIDRDAKLLELLNSDKKPGNFLEFTAACLKRISERINDMIKEKKQGKIPIVTDFDGYALTALGLTLSELIWFEKDSDLKGPDLETCFKRIKILDKQVLYKHITKHYIGNIFQHYFEKAGIRRVIKDLPEDEEVLLRQQDALLVADSCFEILKESNKDKFDAFDFIESLDQVINKTI